MSEDRCVMCGAAVPEGLMVCPACKEKAGKKNCWTCFHHVIAADGSILCWNEESSRRYERVKPGDCCCIWEGMK